MIELNWKIAPGYYLYRDHIRVSDSLSGITVGLDLPIGTTKANPGFGSAVVYYEHVSILAAATGGKLKTSYQGCRENSICYPPVVKIIDANSFAITDSEGERAGWAPSRTSDLRRVSRGSDESENIVVPLGYFAVGRSHRLGRLLNSAEPCVWCELAGEDVYSTSAGLNRLERYGPGEAAYRWR